jgi:hypothetical protein
MLQCPDMLDAIPWAEGNLDLVALCDHLYNAVIDDAPRVGDAKFVHSSIMLPILSSSCCAEYGLMICYKR